jgi:hypothetical protein
MKMMIQGHGQRITTVLVMERREDESIRLREGGPEMVHDLKEFMT